MTSRMRSQRKENQRKVIHLLLMKLIAPYTKKSKELSKIFITPANFDKKQKKQELRCIRYRKSTGKKQDFMPDGILFPIGIKRENPEFTPYKVMNLRHYISHYIGYHVMFTLYMHEQSYNQCSYQGVQCTYYGKT